MTQTSKNYKIDTQDLNPLCFWMSMSRDEEGNIKKAIFIAYKTGEIIKISNM